MATMNIVPRSSNEGKLGTELRKWAEVNSVAINTDALITKSITTVSPNGDSIDLYTNGIGIASIEKNANNQFVIKIDESYVGIGSLSYKGLYDADIAVPDISSGKKGDFYKVSNAGNLFGIDWQIGDHLIINEDMGGTIDPNKIDKIDNTESISVLSDLLDVELESEIDRQALVFNNGVWENGTIVYEVPDLEDVFLEEKITSASYTSSYSSEILYKSRDHIVDCRALTPVNGKKTMTLPNTLQEGDKIYISNIGGGEIRLQVSGSTYFPGLSTNYRDYGSNVRIIATGTIVTQTENIGGVPTEVDYMVWSISTEVIGERQVLASKNDLVSWGNHFLNVAHVQGAARQGELDTIEASVGLASDGTYVEHLTTNFINSSTTMRSADVLLDLALKAEQTSRISTDNSLQSQITSNLNEINEIENSVGLESDGSLPAWNSAYVIQAGHNVKEAVEAVDTEMEIVRQLVVSGVDDLQVELDETQAGAGLEEDGTYVAPTGTNYLGSASTLKSADVLLDGVLKTEIDNRISEIARVDGVNATQNSRLSNLESKDISLQNEIDQIEQSVGLAGDGSLPAWSSTGTTIGSTSNIKSAVEALDSEMEEVRQLTVSGVDNLQTETDSTQQGAGLEDDGTYIPHAGANYISGASSLHNADLLLDTALKAEETARIDADGVLTQTTVDIQAELDNTQTGAGLDSDGNYVPYEYSFLQVLPDRGFLESATSLHEADKLIDDQLIEFNKNFYYGTIINNVFTIDTQEDYQTAYGFNRQGDFTWIFSRMTFSATGVHDNADFNPSSASGRANFTMKGHTGTTGGVACTSLNFGLIITGPDALRNTVEGFRIVGTTTVDGTQGAHQFINNQHLGGITLSNHAVGTWMMFKDCEIAGDVLIESTFLGTVYFINCEFNVNSFTNDATAQNVIINQAAKFPFANLADITPAGTVGFDNQTVWNFNTHISLPNAPSFTGKTSQLTGDYINLPNANAFTGNFSELNDDIGYITAGAAPVQSINSLQGDVVLTGNNINSGLTNNEISNYTHSDNKLDSHLLGIDTVLGDLGTASLADIGTTEVGHVVALIENGGFLRLPSLDGTLLTGIPRDLNSLNGFLIDNLTNQDALVYNDGLQAWINRPIGNTALSNSYTDLDDLPILGTACSKDVGTADSNVVQLTEIDGIVKLPPVDGSLLTDVNISDKDLDELGNVTVTNVFENDGIKWDGAKWVNTPLSAVTFTGEYIDLTGTPTTYIGGSTFITDANPLTLEGGIHYIMGTALGSTKVLTLPDANENGDYIRITNWGNGDLLLQVDQTSPTAYLLKGNDILLNGQVTINSKSTVDLYGFNYDQGGIDYTPAWGVYFQQAVEINTDSLTTSGQMLVYNATAGEFIAGDVNDLALSYTPTNYDNTVGGTVSGDVIAHHLEGMDEALGSKLTANDGLDGLGDVDLTTNAPNDNDVLVYDLISQTWYPEAISIPTINDATTDTKGIVELATDGEAAIALATDLVLTCSNLSSVKTETLDNSNETLLEKANNLSELTATASTARTNLGLGTASVLDAGSSIGDVITFVDNGGNAAYPPIDGSLIQNVLPGINGITIDTPGGVYNITSHTGAQETYILTPTQECSLYLPSGATVGAGYIYVIKNMSSFDIVIKATVDGQGDYTMTNQYSAITLVSDGANDWYII